MTSGMAEVLAGLEASRRVAWAKYYAERPQDEDGGWRSVRLNDGEDRLMWRDGGRDSKRSSVEIAFRRGRDLQVPFAVTYLDGLYNFPERVISTVHVSTPPVDGLPTDIVAELRKGSTDQVTAVNVGGGCSGDRIGVLFPWAADK